MLVHSSQSDRSMHLDRQFHLGVILDTATSCLIGLGFCGPFGKVLLHVRGGALRVSLTTVFVVDPDDTETGSEPFLPCHPLVPKAIVLLECIYVHSKLSVHAHMR